MTNLNVITQYQNPVQEHADVCIIGTGAGGSMMAHELSKKDKKVIMLERGGFYDINYLQQHKEEDLLKLWKYYGFFPSRNFSVTLAQGECVGGSTMINYGICFDIPDDVFEKWLNQNLFISVPNVVGKL